jgi:serine O-acetyltransferase
MFERMRNEINNALKKDPAARTRWEVYLCYPGLHAIWSHRFNHWLWNKNCKTLARFLAFITRSTTGIDIHPGAEIGDDVFIDHGMGVVIGETAKLGNNITLYQGVTLGGTNLERTDRHPTVEDDVIVGAGAKVLGNITIGKGSRIGANAVVVKPVPPYSVVVGVPGQIISRSKPQEKLKEDLPDAIGMTLTSVLKRLERIEDSLQGKMKEETSNVVHAPDKGIWQGIDFEI